MNALGTIASNGIPGVNALAPFAAQLLGHASRHIYALGGTLLSATGLAALLPSLTIFSVNVLGFTSAGVAAGASSVLLTSYPVSNLSQLGLYCIIRFCRCSYPVVLLWCIYQRYIRVAYVVRGHGGDCAALIAGLWCDFFGSGSRVLGLEVGRMLGLTPRRC
jgi:hypothetical protein